MNTMIIFGLMALFCALLVGKILMRKFPDSGFGKKEGDAS